MNRAILIGMSIVALGLMMNCGGPTSMNKNSTFKVKTLKETRTATAPADAPQPANEKPAEIRTGP